MVYLSKNPGCVKIETIRYKSARCGEDNFISYHGFLMSEVEVLDNIVHLLAVGVRCSVFGVLF
jgi:hypothetical protein